MRKYMRSLLFIDIFKKYYSNQELESARATPRVAEVMQGNRAAGAGFSYPPPRGRVAGDRKIAFFHYFYFPSHRAAQTSM